MKFKLFKKDEFAGLKGKIKEGEFYYEIEKVKSSLKSMFLTRLKPKKKDKYKYIKPTTGQLPGWAKVLAILIPTLAVTALIAWLASLRPDIILQIRGPEAELLINEEQGKVTALSAMLVLNLLYYESVSILLERRPFIPQGLFSGGIGR